MNGVRFAAIHAQDVAGKIIEGRKPSEEHVKECVFSILSGNVLCSIATVSRAGHPHINTAYFSYSDSLELYFLSHPRSLHCQNLSGNPTMAMTVFSSGQQWTEPDRGVQLFGDGRETSGSSAQEAERSYASRFRAYNNWKASLKDDDLARRYRFYRFAVTDVKIVDETILGDAVWIVGRVAGHEP